MTNPAQTPSILPKHLHVIGICGVAMSAIAIAFQKRGVKVTGSDKGFFPPVSTELDKQGIKYYAGWHPEKMIEEGTPDVVMIGSASGSQNPETTYAREHGIPMFSYPEILGQYFVKENSVVCSGTWGKTSSSALLSFILDEVRMDPSYMFGGVSLSHGSSAKIGDSVWSVFEGDEYKSSPTDSRAKFFHYRPTHLLLTAVSWDHADLYPTEDSYFDAFDKLLAGMSEHTQGAGLLVARAGQVGIQKVVGSFKGKVITYGLLSHPFAVTPAEAGVQNRGILKQDDTATNIPDFTYSNIIQSRTGIDFTISHEGKEFHIHSPLLGAYQAENITGCFTMAISIGINAEKVIAAIAKFNGLKRRMEKRLDGDATNSKGITIIDDIAHSPEKAVSVLATLKEIYSYCHSRESGNPCASNCCKIITIFEPNSGGRERSSSEKYDDAFKDADIVIIPRLTKLKLASNESSVPLAPMEGDELANAISKTHKNTIFIDDDEKLVLYLTSNAKKGDCIAFLGSHGFRGMIEEAVRRLS